MDGFKEEMQKAKEEKSDGETKKSVEDKEAEEAEAKKKAEDKEKEKEKSEAMDSAIKALVEEVKNLKSTAMDGNAVMKAFAAKQELATQVSSIVGAFDHSDLDAQGVAKYGLEKMGIACDSGSELPMMKGILVSRAKPSFTVDHGTAQDGAQATTDNLSKLGL